MGFFKSTKGSIISDYFKLLSNVGTLKKDNMVDVALYDDHLEVTFGKLAVKLNYSQITDVYYGMETEIVQKNKSVIGRAVAGGLLFGNAGAVVGAISGASPKNMKKHCFIFIISYTSSDGTEAFLQFEDTRLYKGTKVYKKLKELVNIPESIVTEL